LHGAANVFYGAPLVFLPASRRLASHETVLPANAGPSHEQDWARRLSLIIYDNVFYHMLWRPDMMRDMDLIRDILLELDANPKLNGRSLHRGRANAFFEKGDVSDDDAAYHLLLLIDRKFVIGTYDRISATFDIERLSMDGHDFLDSVRDLEVWKKTKKGAEAAKGFTIDLLKDLAKGLVKKQIEEFTGVKL
jgi:hypothetical protein